MASDNHSVKPGRYLHFKGGVYQVIGTTTDSETLKEYVLYRTVDKVTDELGKFWHRPAKMFAEEVEWQPGSRGPRFLLVVGD